MDTINKTELKIIIGWCKEKGHSSDETLDLLMRIANGSELKPVPDVILQ